MKSLFFCLSLFGLTVYAQPAFAQADSLTLGDTISVTRQRVLFSVLRKYQYHLASELNSAQLVSLLKKTPNDDVSHYVRRYKQQQALSFAFMGTGYASMISGLIITREHPALSLPLMAGGLGLFYGAPVFRSEHTMERAVSSFNLGLRSGSGDYYQPTIDLRPQSDRITLADTVTIKGRFPFYRYKYRGIQVDPASQLKPAFAFLNSGRVNTNMRYIRTVRRVSGFVYGLASTTLSTYFLLYAARRATGPYPVNRALVYPALTLLGVSIAGGWHANHQQAGTMREYNERLKKRQE